jgi:cyclohexadienyl dehydratase
MSIEAIDHPDVRVVVKPGASNHKFARTHFSRANLMIQSDNSTIFNEIIEGRAGVTITDGTEVNH